MLTIQAITNYRYMRGYWVGQGLFALASSWSAGLKVAFTERERAPALQIDGWEAGIDQILPITLMNTPWLL